MASAAASAAAWAAADVPAVESVALILQAEAHEHRAMIQCGEQGNGNT